MREHFLFFVWQHQLYNRDSLCTSEGEELQIINPGFLNTNAGPDFLEAHVSIDGLQWKGNIEIHVEAKDWYTHSHHKDPAFNNVILHVVFNNNAEALTSNKRCIPCLELKSRIGPTIIRRHKKLENNTSWIPCAASIRSVRKLTVNMTVERAAHSRIYEKAQKLLLRLQQLNTDWHQLAFESLTRSFGFNINSDAFELLARQTPFAIIQRNASNLSLIEALLLGQGSLIHRLPKMENSRMLRDYNFLKLKYDLQSINAGVCRFLRTRPSNFPHLRLIQLACLFHHSPQLTGLILSIENYKEWINNLAVPKSPLWEKVGPKSAPHSASSALLLYINTVLPLQLAFAIKNGNQASEQKVIQKYYHLLPEKNAVINRWRELGLEIGSAFQTQGLIQLHKNHCRKKECAQCPIGIEILTSSLPSNALLSPLSGDFHDLR